MASNFDLMLIKGGRVLLPDGDLHHPPVMDILVRGNLIEAISPEIDVGPLLDQGPDRPPLISRTLNATGKLVVPGFFNAHYHSHDVLLKGVFETEPLEIWLLQALPPGFPKRSREEIKVRTLLGAAECIRSGMTTIQDLVTIFPFDEDHLDAVMEAYEEIGIRAVVALQVADLKGIEGVPFWSQTVPEGMRKHLTGAVEPFGTDLPIVQLVEQQYLRLKTRHPRIHWAVGPTSPERCSAELLTGLDDVGRRHNLPTYTHIYESKSMCLHARKNYPNHSGSLIRFMKDLGILGPHLSLAHSVWMLPSEIELIAETGTHVVLNPVGNLKTRSGVAPIREYLEAGVNVALGCDNCSCSDSQNMFQSMKFFSLLASVSHPQPGRPDARDSLHAATLAGARAAGLEKELGTIQPGKRADLILLDMTDPSFVPLNSALRQLVYTEGGRGVETVIIDGQVVMENRRLTTIDEIGLNEAVAGVMTVLAPDIERVKARNREIYEYLVEAHMMTWNEDVGMNRYIASYPD